VIRVLFFSSARQAAGVESLSVSAAEAKTVSGLLDNLCAKFPGLAAMRRSLLVTANLEMCDSEKPLKDGDEVAVKGGR
jgi:molybdopterin converting factor small subunit